MPPILHPESFSITSLFTSTALLAFLGAIHVLPCPVNRPGLQHADEVGNGAERKKTMRKCPVPWPTGLIGEILEADGAKVKKVILEERGTKGSAVSNTYAWLHLFMGFFNVHIKLIGDDDLPTIPKLPTQLRELLEHERLGVTGLVFPRVIRNSAVDGATLKDEHSTVAFETATVKIESPKLESTTAPVATRNYQSVDRRAIGPHPRESNLHRV
ncbi:hypothetical protein RUND412_000084 [Rhizina undulata]